MASRRRSPCLLRAAAGDSVGSVVIDKDVSNDKGKRDYSRCMPVPQIERLQG